MSIGELGLLGGAALLVGAIVRLTGVGGGSIMTPLLITVFGVPAPIAVGTDLACAAVTKTAGAIAHGAAHNVASHLEANLGTLMTSSAFPAAACASAA